MGSLNIFNFPAKKLRKNTGAAITHAPFMFIHSVSNICSIVVNFPAKRLRKNTGLKNTHAPNFFFFTYYVYNFFLYFLVVFMR